MLDRWDDGLADRLAAENLFLDESRDRRHQAIARLLAEHGTCRPDAGFDVENALRGQWTLTCDRGALLAGITLAPTMPPKVQSLTVQSLDPGGPARSPACSQ